MMSVAKPVAVASVSGERAQIRAAAPRQVVSFRNSSFVAGRTCEITSTSGVQTGRGALQVCAAKGKSMGRKMPGKGQQEQFQLPPLDPENPQFMLYVRSKAVPQWYPVSVVTGGSAAKAMVKMANGNFGKDFYTGALTRNVGSVIYKDENAIRNLVFKSYPLLRKAAELQWGYKLLDPENPKKSMMPSGVVLVPPKDENKAPLEGVADKLKGLFGGN